jgi:hypothetical protein
VEAGAQIHSRRSKPLLKTILLKPGETDMVSIFPNMVLKEDLSDSHQAAAFSSLHYERAKCSLNAGRFLDDCGNG